MKKNDPWSKLDEMFAAEPEPTGEEWFTAADLAKRYGMADSTARNRVKEMKEQGMVEHWTGVPKGKGNKTTKYRLK